MAFFLPGYEKTDSFAELIRCSAYEVKYCIVSTFDSLRMLFTKQLPVEEAVTGPGCIVSMVGETVAQGRDAGTRALMVILANWVLLLSSSLGIMICFPFRLWTEDVFSSFFLSCFAGNRLIRKRREWFIWQA